MERPVSFRRSTAAPKTPLRLSWNSMVGRTALAFLPFTLLGCLGHSVPPGVRVYGSVTKVAIQIGDPRSAGEDVKVWHPAAGAEPDPDRPQSVHYYDVRPIPFYIGQDGEPLIVGILQKPVVRDYGSLFGPSPRVMVASPLIRRSPSEICFPENADAAKVIFLLRADMEDLGWRLLRPTAAELRDGINIEDLSTLPLAELDPLGKSCLKAAEKSGLQEFLKKSEKQE